MRKKAFLLKDWVKKPPGTGLRGAGGLACVLTLE